MRVRKVENPVKIVDFVTSWRDRSNIWMYY